MSAVRNFVSQGRKIVAIGRNFSEHAKELNNPVPKSPFFFLKPTSSYLVSGGNVEIPKGCDVHHEIELCVVVGKEARDLRASDAFDYVAGERLLTFCLSIFLMQAKGYALGIDMTARNLQAEAKKKGLPWSMAKGFDTFTPIRYVMHVPDLCLVVVIPLLISLLLRDVYCFDIDVTSPSSLLDNVLKQQGNTSDMIFNIPTLLEFVTSIMRLEPGDLLMTGTPAGVGPIQPGQTITAGLKVGSSETDLMQVRFGIVERKGEARL
ncbi:hypothetical protein BC938DRAFT_475552 [Jimgerdemannia flammicorona]|uniref:Fumarylacetoacetase-like C-terminal domain-containing protein n=1 Tax=Jimgerdemannia flammicorona TaxID=994334 RepID=A0A433PST2_9FUNG|nr:hypothetical protein BC938DRAFT_475552 [Jimgerdemannia flammicorona]